MDKNILLSELIRIGSKVTEKGVGFYFPDDNSACAIGAAYWAKYLTKSMAGGSVAVDDFLNSMIGKDVSNNPETGFCQPLSSVIFSLNDKYGWTREKIADWLESIGY